MAKIKLSYAKEEDIPEAHKELYEQSEDGKSWALTGVEGLKTQDDITRATKALDNERKAHAQTKAKFKVFEGLDPETVKASLDEVDDLRAKLEIAEAGGNKIDDAKLQGLVDAKVKRTVAPLERERDKLRADLATAEARASQLDGTLRAGNIEREVRAAALDQKVVASALEDVSAIALSAFELDEHGNVVTKDGLKNIPPGLTPKEWLSNMQERRPHWWPQSVGGGAGLGGRGGAGMGFGDGGNPWAGDKWNMTAQGQYLRQHGMEKAQQAARMAGTTVGGPRPAVKAA